MDERRLASVPLFASLSRAERREIARLADEVDVDAGRRLVGQGELAYEFFVIEAGTAAVSIDGEQVAELGPGDFFGEMGVTDAARRRNASVVATSPLTAIVMTRRALRHVDHEMPSVHARLCEAIKERSAATATAAPG